MMGRLGSGVVFGRKIWLTAIMNLQSKKHSDEKSQLNANVLHSCVCPMCSARPLILRDRPLKAMEDVQIQRWYHGMPKMIGALSICVVSFLVSIWMVITMGLGHWLWLVMSIGVIVTLSVVILVDRHWEFSKNYWLICKRCGWSECLRRG